MLRRTLSIVGVCAVATLTAAVAQPKKPAPKADAKAKKTPGTPGKDAGSAAAPAPGDAGSGAGSAVQMTEDPPPKDPEGRDENPGAPGGVAYEEPTKIVVPAKQKAAGYPITEALRPINLPANMSEVSISPHAQLGFGEDAVYKGGDALRARYGITRQVQLGLTYTFAGAFDDPATMEDSIGVHGGKAVGLDVTVLLEDWIGVRVGVPVYIKPVAYSLTIGAPMKFTFGDKYAFGGFDDLLNIRLHRFAPSFYQEADNAANAEADRVDTALSRGNIRISMFGVYNRDPKTAIIARLGFQLEDFTATETSSDAPNAGISYFVRAGVNYSPRKFLDLGLSLGFDDLAHYGSFGPAGFLAFRI